MLRPLCLLALFLVPAGARAQEPDLFEIQKNFELFGRIYEQLAAGYVDPVAPEPLMREGIEAMLRTLDPYTVFFDEAANEDMDLVMRGGAGGAGLAIGARGETLVIVEALEGYSAWERGVRAGDVLLEIDGQPLRGRGADEARSLLQGAPGTTVRIRVQRPGEDAPLDFVLTRSPPDLSSVGFSGRAAPGVGFVHLERFGRDAAQGVREAVEALQAEGDLEALVLDLRGNRGGLLGEAVTISGLFLPQGTVVVSTRGRAPQTVQTYRTQGPPLLPDLPVAVLIDGESASASEIVAGALQDHDRAVVVGGRSFGKGLVQVVQPLPYNTSVKLTVSRYFTPSGRAIQSVTYRRNGAGPETADADRQAYRTSTGRTVYDGRGIDPDVPVELGAPSDLEDALVREAAFARFAAEYAADQPGLPAGFVVDDALYARFRAFVEREGVAYQTAAERTLQSLQAELEASGYGDARDEVADLARAIAAEKDADFERHAPRLRERIRRAVVARFVGQRAQTEAAFGSDPVLSRALEILGDAALYTRTLGR